MRGSQPVPPSLGTVSDLFRSDPFLEMVMPTMRMAISISPLASNCISVSLLSGEDATVELITPDIQMRASEIVEFMASNFRQDDDCLTADGRAPWARIREQGVEDSSSALDLAAVIAGKKPAAIVNENGWHSALTRHLAYRAHQDGRWLTELGCYEKPSWVVGGTEAISRLKEAAALIRGIPEPEWPLEYFRIFGRALGYSEAAVAAFVQRLGEKRNQSKR